jgi:hypothetical protein
MVRFLSEKTVHDSIQNVTSILSARSHIIINQAYTGRLNCFTQLRALLVLHDLRKLFVGTA